MRQKMDVRLIVGLGLVVASVAGVYALVAATDRTTAVYVASSSLPVGAALTVSDLGLVHVRLSAASPLYVEEGSLPSNAVITQSLKAGELLPLSAVGDVRDITSTTLVLTLTSGLPAEVTTGESVDIWSAPQQDQGDFGPPTIVVSAAQVARIKENSGIGSATDGLSVEVVIPRSKVGLVLQGQANGDSIFLVPTQAGRSS